MRTSPLIRTPASTTPHLFHSPNHVIFTRRLPIHKELHKNPQIQQQRAQTPNQPARINEHIPPIHRHLLSRPTLPRHRTKGRISHDTHDIRQVPDAGKQEKQQRHALGALATPVQQDLRHARAKVEEGAQVAEDLAPDVEAEGVAALAFQLRLAVAVAATADPPAEDAGGADEDDGEGVEEDRLRGGGGRQVCGGGRVRGAGGGGGGGGGRFEERRRGREVRAVDAGQVLAEGGGGARAVVAGVGGCVGGVSVAVRVAVGSGEEGLVFGGVVVFDERLGRGVGEGEAAVVEALAEQDDVCERVVDCQDDHGWEDALEHGSQDVEDIAGEPDDDEEEGETVCRTAAEVFDDLGGEDHDPACN